MLFILIISYLLLLKMNYCRKIHLHKSKFYDIMYIDEQVSYNKKGYVWCAYQTLPQKFFWLSIWDNFVESDAFTYLLISTITSNIIITNNRNIKTHRNFSLVVFFILYLLYIKIRPKSPDNNRRKHLNFKRIRVHYNTK